MDAEVQRISIQTLENDILQLEFILKLRDNVLVKFIFENIVEYSLFISSDNYFYTVSDYILEKYGDNYYLSLDPHDSSRGINNEDMDYVKSKSLFIEILN